jgi:hypothetical protein
MMLEKRETGARRNRPELILFQVGGRGEPLMIIAEPPRG